MTEYLVSGQIVSFSDSQNLVHHKKGVIVLGDDGKINWVGAKKDLSQQHQQLNIHDYGDKLILPGFIDPHIHFPQYRMLAAPAKDLLDWLTRFTFAEEAQFADLDIAERAAKVFLALLMANGTTSVCAFSSSHQQSAQALFSVAEQFGMALITGKTMMDINAPENVTDTALQAYDQSLELIENWHNKSRLEYAITPRFAITSSNEQLQVAGKLLAENPGMVMQTHLSENDEEIAQVTNRFSSATDYTDVYDQFGLLGQSSLFGHGIHLSQRELERLAQTGSRIIHCPTSNTFLGSGLFNLKRAQDAGVKVGIASDIAGGTSYSMLKTMAEAYKVAMLSGYMPSTRELYFLATLGNAQCLNLDEHTGSLEVGKWADLVVLDPKATHLQRFRQDISSSLDDTLFSLMMLGDDRSVSATYVAGQLRYRAAVS